MALTCLQIIQTVCYRIGIVAPPAVVTSQDNQVLQLLALANQEGKALAKRYPWEVLQTEATFTTVAAQLQGAMSTIAPGFKYVTNNTMWDRTLRLPVLGSQSQQDWQQNVALQLTNPYSRYRIKGDSLYFYPVPAAGHTVAFEFISQNWVSKASGGTNSVWTADGDTPLLWDDLIVEGVTWRWKAAKGLDYTEAYSTYEASLADAMARDGSKLPLSMTGATHNLEPVVIVPRGSWGV